MDFDKILSQRDDDNNDDIGDGGDTSGGDSGDRTGVNTILPASPPSPEKKSANSSLPVITSLSIAEAVHRFEEPDCYGSDDDDKNDSGSNCANDDEIGEIPPSSSSTSPLPASSVPASRSATLVPGRTRSPSSVSSVSSASLASRRTRPQTRVHSRQQSRDVHSRARSVQQSRDRSRAHSRQQSRDLTPAKSQQGSFGVAASMSEASAAVDDLLQLSAAESSEEVTPQQTAAAAAAAAAVAAAKMSRGAVFERGELIRLQRENAEYKRRETVTLAAFNAAKNELLTLRIRADENAKVKEQLVAAVSSLSKERDDIEAYRRENADLRTRCRRLHAEAVKLESFVSDARKLGDDKCAAMQGTCRCSRTSFQGVVTFRSGRSPALCTIFGMSHT